MTVGDDNTDVAWLAFSGSVVLQGATATPVLPEAGATHTLEIQVAPAQADRFDVSAFLGNVSQGRVGLGNVSVNRPPSGGLSVVRFAWSGGPSLTVDWIRVESLTDG